MKLIPFSQLIDEHIYMIIHYYHKHEKVKRLITGNEPPKITLLLSLENSVGIQFSEFLKDHKNLDCFIFIEQMLCLSSAYQES